MNVKDCVLGAVVAAAIFAGANADTPATAPTPMHATAASVQAPGFAVLRVGLGQVLDIVGALAAFAKQL